MSGKLIYEKHYPKDDPCVSMEEDALEADCNSAVTEDASLTFEQIMKEIYKDVVYVLMPERQKKALTFLTKAVEIAETYELDTKIEEHIDHISVNYYFDCSGCMGFLKSIIVYADDISFFNNIDGFDIVISIDFYTHAVYRNNRRVKP